VAAVALEAGDEHPEIQRACEQAYNGWIDTIAAGLVRAGWPAERAREDASVALSAVEGALILSRVTRSVQPLRNVSRALALQLEKVPAQTGFNGK